MITRQQRQRMKTENKRWPLFLKEVPKEDWPESRSVENKPFRVYRNRAFLVQEYKEQNGIRRLSVNRTTMKPNGRWDENITWEELQDLKRQAGYGDWYAVEIYPPENDLVNVANMRHLWVLPEPLEIGWRN